MISPNDYHYNKKMVTESDKVHVLFKTFHAHELPNKRALCDELKNLIDTKKIRGSATIDKLLENLHTGAINSDSLRKAIYKVLYNDSEYETDDDDPIQLAQHVPENQTQETFVPDKEKKEIVNMCNQMIEHLKEVERSYLLKCANRAYQNIEKMQVLFNHYMEIIKLMINNN